MQKLDHFRALGLVPCIGLSSVLIRKASATCRNNVRLCCLMRALHDGKWNQLTGTILLWRKPILSKEFIERKMAQMDRLAALLTTLGMRCLPLTPLRTIDAVLALSDSRLRSVGAVSVLTSHDARRTNPHDPSTRHRARRCSGESAQVWQSASGQGLPVRVPRDGPSACESS